MIRYGQTLVGLLLFLFACAGQSAQYSAYSLRLMHEIDQAPKAQGQPLLSEGLKKKFGIRDTQSGPVVHWRSRKEWKTLDPREAGEP